ncbi:MAG: DUF4230 domain-containing protein [Pseudomonadota bacterium]|jgi:hypothetical protein|uniref:DUF4230 domain-containing protein n=1 Tax=Qipengyuania pacifica TaxID=2860199 RepID=A0ABS7JF58_9SPHN|nr:MULTISPECIES: DUF4230 domain-containing protein [Erythrobacteraceae]MAB44162.1 hypothetical protein [Sphingomonadaceae bacterium]MAP68946.1 hypothetical protein [Erythrobacteraceae bacterium]MBL4895292.1 DUF4230 domain-containing protein [Erythrobacter sp.]MEC7889535.1 DUF4230 domain-containing protein [Pseudomonadota bacterium]QPL39605.1 DUF4230 domain-containing protein [Erythrobacter sp. A30-3]|tara:strand:- start:867 stop:1553 length:687 start_codon:yes stop_codon:yes gene_type:complete
MADDLKTRKTTVEPQVRREQSLARTQAVPWLIVIVLLAAAAWLGWRAFFYHEEGDPVGSAMLAFEKQNSLTVFSSRFEVVAESEDRRGIMGVDLLKSRQAAIIPATVEYRLDLSTMDRDRFEWNDSNDTMTVVLPQLRISRPNLDEAEQKTFTEGTYVSRDASADLARNNSRQAERKAAEFAKNPEVLALARQAAKDAVRQNLAIPLEVAGYGNVTVNVRFDGEKQPG